MISNATPFRAIIADDEPLARECVRAALANRGGVAVVAECGDGPETVAAIRELRPDLVFLDVQMPGMNGFEVVDQVGPSEMPAVIFVTAFDEHALRAFEVHALDYVLKPFDDARLHEAVEHARGYLGGRRAGELARRLRALLDDAAGRRREHGSAARLAVREHDHIRFIAVEDVDWLEAYGNYVRLHAGPRTHLIRTTLGGLLDALDPRRFIRIHRSAAVNIDRVAEVEPWSSGDAIATLRDGQKLRISRSYKDGLLRAVL